jgi:chromosome segregation ATPase
LEQRIGNLTEELLQVQGLRNDDLKQRQHVAGQLQQLLKAEASLTAKLCERTQAEASLRNSYAELGLLAKAQHGDLERLRCELESERGSRGRAVEEQTELKEAHPDLLKEMARCKQAEEGLRRAQGELQTRIAEQTTALAQVCHDLDNEVSRRVALENSASNLAAIREKLESELNERESELEALRCAHQQAQAHLGMQTDKVAEVHARLSMEIDGHQRTKQQRADLTKALDSLEKDSNKFKRDEETLKLKQTELETQLADQTEQIEKIQSDLQEELSLRQQAEAKSHDLAEAQSALTRELAEHSKTVTALSEAQAKLFCLERKRRFGD